MKCWNCDSECSKEAEYCPKCGCKLIVLLKTEELFKTDDTKIDSAEDNIESRTERELESGIESNIGNDIEGGIESNIERELEGGIESDIENDIEGGIESDIESLEEDSTEEKTDESTIALDSLWEEKDDRFCDDEEETFSGESGKEIDAEKYTVPEYEFFNEKLNIGDISEYTESDEMKDNDDISEDADSEESEDGESISENDSFGENEEDSDDESSDENNDSSEKSKEKKNKKSIIKGIIIAAVIAAAGICAFVFVNGTNNNSGESKLSEQLQKQIKGELYEKLPDDTTETPTETVTETPVAEQTETPEETAAPEATPEPTAEPTAAPTAAPVEETISATVEETTAADVSGYSKITVDSATASSVIEQDGIDNSPNMLLDDDPTTSWQEGVDGNGEGESVGFEFNGEVNVHCITFKLGNWRSYENYTRNSRPKSVTVMIGDKSFNVEFPDEMKEYTLKLSQDIRCNGISIVINSVYEGTRYDDTCISDIGIYG